MNTFLVVMAMRPFSCNTCRTSHSCSNAHEKVQTRHKKVDTCCLAKEG